MPERWLLGQKIPRKLGDNARTATTHAQFRRYPHLGNRQWQLQAENSYDFAPTAVWIGSTTRIDPVPRAGIIGLILVA